MLELLIFGYPLLVLFITSKNMLGYILSVILMVLAYEFVKEEKRKNKELDKEVERIKDAGDYWWLL